MTRKLTPAQLDEIVAAAEEATPGPWRWKKPGIDYYEVLNVHTTVAVDMVKQADAVHIAMMDPATTLALVAEVRELRAKVGRVREIIGDTQDLDPDWGGCEGAWDAQLLEILIALGEGA